MFGLPPKGNVCALTRRKGRSPRSCVLRSPSAKPELLGFLQRSDFFRICRPPPIPRRTSKDPAPLSFAQERLWFLEQLEPGSAVYNICRASRLTGQLNVTALEASLTEILRRHEILRSQIRVVEGRPMQLTAVCTRIQITFYRSAFADRD